MSMFLTKTRSHHCQTAVSTTSAAFHKRVNINRISLEQTERRASNETRATTERKKKIHEPKLLSILINLLIFITYLTAAKLELSLA